MSDPIEEAKTALKEYQAAYDRLTDCKGVQALEKMLAELEPERPDSIVVGIFHQQIREVREKQRPDLPVPLSLKDDFVRQVIKSLGSTDFEKTLGRRIEDLESSLRFAKEPKNLREEMQRLLEKGIDKYTVGSVVVSFFDGVREGKNVCCRKEPEMAMLDRIDDVTELSCVDGGDEAPFLSVLTSPDSPRHPDDKVPLVVFPMRKIMDGLRRHEALAGLAFDPWDRGGLYLNRDFLLQAWERNEAYHQEQLKNTASTTNNPEDRHRFHNQRIKP